MYSDAEQIEALLRIGVELSNNKNNQYLISSEEKKQEEKEREELVLKSCKSQGINTNSAKLMSIAINAKKETSDPLAMRLQEDNRYLLNNILNIQEVMKNDIREIKKLLGQIETVENDTCCYWPFGKEESL
jgi:hypothetical protein